MTYNQLYIYIYMYVYMFVYIHNVHNIYMTKNLSITCIPFSKFLTYSNETNCRILRKDRRENPNKYY